MHGVNYQPGDYVLYWQPGSDKSSSSNATIDKEEPLVLPNKWTNRWTGPHRIRGRHNDNLYEFVHCKTGEVIKAHVNRLCIFHPWSDDLPSTSPDADEELPWSVSGRASAGEFFITALEDCENWPFAVGRVTGLRGENGDMIDFVWYSNSTDNIRGVMKPGWRKPDGSIYYDDKRDEMADVPYTGKHSGTVVTHSDLIVRGFSLTATKRLPKSVLRVVSASPLVDWTLPEGAR